MQTFQHSWCMPGDCGVLSMTYIYKSGTVAGIVYITLNTHINECIRCWFYAVCTLSVNLRIHFMACRDCNSWSYTPRQVKFVGQWILIAASHGYVLNLGLVKGINKSSNFVICDCLIQRHTSHPIIVLSAQHLSITMYTCTRVQVQNLNLFHTSKVYVQCSVRIQIVGPFNLKTAFKWTLPSETIM